MSIHASSSLEAANPILVPGVLPYVIIGVWILGFVISLIASIRYPQTILDMLFLLN